MKTLSSVLPLTARVNTKPRTWTVVDFDEIEADEEAEVNPEAQYSVEQAQSFKPGAVLGDVIEEQVESVAFGRIAAQTAKQVIVQKVREAERAQVVEAYESRVNELVSGTVKKLGRDSVIVDLGNNAEGILTRNISFREKSSALAIVSAPCLWKFVPIIVVHS